MDPKVLHIPHQFCPILTPLSRRGEWVIKTHVIIFHENEGVRCLHRFTIGLGIKRPNIDSLRAKVKKEWLYYLLL